MASIHLGLFSDGFESGNDAWLADPVDRVDRVHCSWFPEPRAFPQRHLFPPGWPRLDPGGDQADSYPHPLVKSPLFQRMKGNQGLPPNPQSIDRNVVKPYAGLAGIDPFVFSPHSLRATSATNAIEGGASFVELRLTQRL